MYDGTEVLLALVIGIPAALAGIYLFFLGPLGWFAIAFLVLGGMAVRSLVEDTEDRSRTRTNCPACGSPNDSEDDACAYCGAAI